MTFEPDSLVNFIRKKKIPLHKLNILDLGCGQTQFLVLLDHENPIIESYVGVDIDEDIHPWAFSQVISVGSTPNDTYDQIHSAVFLHEKLARNEFDELFKFRCPLSIQEYIKGLASKEFPDGPFNIVILSNIVHLMPESDVRYIFEILTKNIKTPALFYMEYFFQNVKTCYQGARNVTHKETQYIQSLFDEVVIVGEDFTDKHIFYGIIY